MRLFYNSTIMNALQYESSPYLKQHQNNPVNWMPWGSDALKMARTLDKLIIVSIGYSSCHWCHVMENETFENEKAAAFMNEHFVSIKVDREERPDVDHAYMDALQLMSRQGGWPLNMITLPDGRPVWGGTYFPTDQWLNALSQVQQLFVNERDKLLEYATKLANNTKQLNLLGHKATNQQQVVSKKPARLVQFLLNRMDDEHGGLSGAPKFPMPEIYGFLLYAAELVPSEELNLKLEHGLQQMAQGGIYDQVGGGFARYSVDDKWKVPHFEKMLYDNALLVQAYAKAYRKTQQPLFARVVQETTKWLEREMLLAPGCYQAALDADSENGLEGAFYVYTYQELQECFNEVELQQLASYWLITPKGNWEDGNNILQVNPDADVADEEVGQWKERLLAYREKAKSKPAADDKVITSWNAMLANAWIEAYKSFNDEQYLNRAREILHRLKTDWEEEGQLQRLGLQKQKKPAFLDDYAFFIEALLSMGQVTGEREWLETARECTSFVLVKFADERQSLLPIAQNLQDAPFTNKVEFQDNVIPSANAVMAYNLWVLHKLFHVPEFYQKCSSMFNTVWPFMQKDPAFFAKWSQLALAMHFPFFEVVVSGPEAKKLARDLQKMHLPNAVIFSVFRPIDDWPLVAEKYHETQNLIYCCRDQSCLAPVKSIEDLKEALINTD